MHFCTMCILRCSFTDCFLSSLQSGQLRNS